MNEPIIKRLAESPETPCPCGTARRILTREDNPAMSIHRVTIRGDAQPHVHHRQTEHYVIIDGQGTIELNGEQRPVGPGDVVLIPPGVVHALHGHFDIVNVVTPAFDPDDEYIVD